MVQMKGERPEIIQQWQYIGDVRPELMADQAFENCRKVGITSLQSYVSWAEIEETKDEFDFSAYDPLVEKIRRHRLKWVPFLIIGPHYATPDWFQASDDSVYARCLEHREDCRIQSIWNPHLPKYVNRFLKHFADHYPDDSLFESLCLGISGSWGESIYPASGGFIGGFHVHPGWWCGDDHAASQFQQQMLEKYGSLARLNQCWQASFKTQSEISFPAITSSPFQQPYLQLLRRIPERLKPYLKKAKNRIQHHGKRLEGQNPEMTIGSVWPDKRRWLDFVDWYQHAMTDWAEFWLKTARSRFPSNKIYLVAGGEGEPILGADFSAQTKVAEKYGAGIRITNQGDDYGGSFVRTRLVSSACRNYGTYFTTEEAGVNRPEGVTMRIYDAITSGAEGMYFKSLIGTGPDPCRKEDLSPGRLTSGAVNLENNIHHYRPSAPDIETAVLFPNTSISILPFLLQSLYDRCIRLRKHLDFDLVDENIIQDGLMTPYRFVIVLEGDLLENETMVAILDWITRGGILIAEDRTCLSGIDTEGRVVGRLSGSCSSERRIGKGLAVWFPGRRKSFPHFVSQILLNPRNIHPWTGLPGISDSRKHVYVSHLEDRVLYYDAKRHKILDDS